jgi:hypothetical protein
MSGVVHVHPCALNVQIEPAVPDIHAHPFNRPLVGSTEEKTHPLPGFRQVPELTVRYTHLHTYSLAHIFTHMHELQMYTYTTV